MDPALMQQILGTSQLGEQQQSTGNELADLIARRRAYNADQPTTGLGALFGRISDMIMGRNENDLRSRQLDLAKQITQRRQSYAEALAGNPMGPATPPGMPSDNPPRIPPSLEDQGQLATMGELSGDPIMSKVGQGALARAQQAPKLALETQQAQKAMRENQAEESPEAGTATRALLGKYGVNNLPPGTPNATLRYLLPTAEKGYTAEQNKEARLESARLMSNARVTAAGMGPTQQPTDATQLEPLPPAGPVAKQYKSQSDAFKKDMDAASASSRSAFGQTANVVFRGARNLALLNQQNPDGSQRQLTLPEWQEVTGGLIAMQTGGVPTERMMKEGLPHDVQGSVAGIMSWLTSEPHAPDRQAWIERFTQNINREEETAKKYQREVQMQRLPSHSQFFSQFPNRAKLAASGYGIDPALIDQIRSGSYRPGPAGGETPPQAGGPKLSPQDQKMVDQARARLAKNPKDATALETLRLNGLTQ